MGNGTTNTSQQHGTDWENLVKTAWMFDGACNHHRSGVARHDIERRFDRRFGLDTAVKAMSARSDSIGMADAPRFFEMAIHRRLLVGQWEQVDEDRKEFVRVHEFILTKAVHRELIRDITASQVLRYHNMIANRGEGPTAADAARGDKNLILEEVKGRHHPALRFDFKIDRHKQRRLQVSLSLSGLIDLVKDMDDYVGLDRETQPLHVLHDERFCQYPLPIAILSPPRVIVPKAAKQEKADNENTLFDCAEQRAPAGMVTAGRSPVRRDSRMDEDLQKELFGSA